METTETDIDQLYFVLKVALSRAVAACVPDSDIDDIKRVTVTLQCDEEQVSITGLNFIVVMSHIPTMFYARHGPSLQYRVGTY